MEKNVVKYDLNKAAIAKMADIYLDLTITDIEDKEQFDAVHSARMVVKSHRVAIEKERKSQKADALEYGRRVDAGAKELFEGLAPIELHLDAEEKKVTDEKKRIEVEKAEADRLKIQERVDGLGTYGVMLPFFDVAAMTDDEFETAFDKAKLDYEAEQKRLADEEETRKSEMERLAVMNAEAERKLEDLAKKEAETKAEADRVAADKALWEAEKKADQEKKDRAEFEKQATEDARISAEIAEKKRQEQEVWDAKEKAEREAKESARVEALKPDKEKLTAWVMAFRESNIPTPNLESEAARNVLYDAIGGIEIFLTETLSKIEEL